MGNVAISVLMPAYNAELFIERSIDSVLAQTRGDFELIVVDDCSTDSTAEILDRIQDPRLRVLRNERNLGIVATLNRAMAAAHGRLIARADADDLNLPTRFAKQAAFLEANPTLLLVGTEWSTLEEGRVRTGAPVGDDDPGVLRWLAHIGNPVGHPTMMFRAEVVERLGSYLREEYKYAEDFDFSHRLLQFGDVAVLPEPLLHYRRHAGSITRTRHDAMTARTVAVLAPAYAGLIGDRALETAELVARHGAAGEPVKGREALQRLGTLLDALLDAFLAAHPLSPEARLRAERRAARLWWNAVQAAMRSGLLRDAAAVAGSFGRAGAERPSALRLSRAALLGLAGPARRVLARS